MQVKVSYASIEQKLRDLAEGLDKKRITTLRALALAYGEAAIEFSPVISGNYVYNWRASGGDMVYDPRYKQAYLKRATYSPLGDSRGAVSVRPRAKGEVNPDSARGAALDNLRRAVANADGASIKVYNATPYAADVERRHMVAGQAEEAARLRLNSLKSEGLLGRSRYTKSALLGGT